MLVFFKRFSCSFNLPLVYDFQGFFLVYIGTNRNGSALGGLEAQMGAQQWGDLWLKQRPSVCASTSVGWRFFWWWVSQTGNEYACWTYTLANNISILVSFWFSLYFSFTSPPSGASLHSSGFFMSVWPASLVSSAVSPSCSQLPPLTFSLLSSSSHSLLSVGFTTLTVTALVSVSSIYTVLDSQISSRNMLGL